MQFFLTGKVIENDSPEHNGREINVECGDNDLFSRDQNMEESIPMYKGDNNTNANAVHK